MVKRSRFSKNMHGFQLAALMVISACIFTFASKNEYFTETLSLFPMLDGHLAVSFQFKTEKVYNPLDQSSEKSFTLFPRALGLMAEELDIERLDLSMTNGRWHNENPEWTRALRAGALLASSSPSGIQLISSIPSENYESLLRGLSGLLLSSFELLLPPQTKLAPVFPRYAFKNVRERSFQYPHFVSSMPRESICLENLLPWTKLLPINGRSGIANLIQGSAFKKKIFGPPSEYLSLKITIDREKLAENITRVTVFQTLSVVLDLPRMRPDIYKLGKLQQKLSFLNIFAQKIVGPSLLSEKSKIIFHHPPIQHILIPAPQPQIIENQEISEYNISGEINLEIEYSENNSSAEIIKKYNEANYFQVQKSLIGATEGKGKLLLDFLNPENNSKVILYFDILPWFITVYLHTAKLSCKNLKSFEETKFIEFLVQQSVNQRKSFAIESILEIPSNGHCKFEIDLEFNLLQLVEYRPDPVRGYEVGSAVVSFMEINKTNQNYEEKDIPRVYSNELQILIPVPDFSMPFNVLIMASTIYMLYFSTMFVTTLIRIFSYEKDSLGHFKHISK